MKRSKLSEAQIALIASAGRGTDPGFAGLPQGGHFGRDVVQMERYGGLTPLEDAVATLERECGNFGYPTTIRDQSSEFISRDLDQKGVELDFSRPGKPMDYALTSRSRKVGAESP